MRGIQRLNIDLNHLASILHAFVFHLDCNGQFFRSVPFRLGFVFAVKCSAAAAYLFYAHVSVGEAVAEGIQGLALKVAVSPAFHGIICKVRQLFRTVIEGNWQLAGGRNLSKEHFGHHCSAPRTRIPNLHHRVRMLLQIPQVHGTAGHVQHNYRLSDLYHRLCQLPLGLRQEQIRLITGSIAVACIPFLAFQRLVKPQT